jgi:hypothetical protein
LLGFLGEIRWGQEETGTEFINIPTLGAPSFNTTSAFHV